MLEAVELEEVRIEVSLVLFEVASRGRVGGVEG